MDFNNDYNTGVVFMFMFIAINNLYHSYNYVEGMDLIIYQDLKARKNQDYNTFSDFKSENKLRIWWFFTGVCQKQNCYIFAKKKNCKIKGHIFLETLSSDINNQHE